LVWWFYVVGWRFVIFTAKKSEGKAMKIRFMLPLILFILVGLILWKSLALHPERIPSPLVNKVAPRFELPVLAGEKLKTTNQDFLGHVTLLNVWATWCVSCANEHDFLLQLANEKNITLYGLNYKDNVLAAKKWLQEKGNPYRLVAIDEDGAAAIDWGVYGTPETFVIDKKGIIRYKQIGPLTPEVWEQNIKPLVAQLWNEA
jgi:cytochrome c biogenesis protein CcmG, thiol:disulfide interchange protein DsbE